MDAYHDLTDRGTFTGDSTNFYTLPDIFNHMDESITVESLQKQIADTQAQDNAKLQQLQMQAQQTGQHLQAVVQQHINTMGQIAELEAQAEIQTRECYQLEGMMRVFSSILPQQQ